MADETFYIGNRFFLYLRNGGSWKPFSCMTSNGLSETWDFAEVTTACDPGVTRRKPTTYSYEIPFEGVFTDTELPGGDTSKVSWDTATTIARAKTRFDWKIALLRKDGSEEPNFAPQYGTAYFSALEISATDVDFITFTATLLGDGDITTTDPYPGY